MNGDRRSCQKVNLWTYTEYSKFEYPAREYTRVPMDKQGLIKKRDLDRCLGQTGRVCHADKGNCEHFKSDTQTVDQKPPPGGRNDGQDRKRRLAKLLRKIRIDSGLTQVQVADCIGEPQSYVSKYENGEQRLDLIEIEEICRVVGLSLCTFIGLYIESKSTILETNKRILGECSHD